jgi:hypothetical protein
MIMKNELLKAEKIENEISIIEQSHKSAILFIHENMEQLINDCISIDIVENDKESYDRAVELKRVVKATHIAVEKKRKEVKQPLIDYGKRLDRWVEQIYNPLVDAEKTIKKKMEFYEEKQEKLKHEQKLIEEENKNEELNLENRLKILNAQLEKINLAKNKSQLKEIEIYLDSIDISDFGKKSNEAGFILNQLKMTISMASRLMKDEEELSVELPKMETTLNSDDFLDTQEVLIKNEEGIFEEVSFPVSKPSTELIKVSDEDVLNLIDFISISTIDYIKNFVDDHTESLLNNAESFDNKDFSKHKNLIHSEVKKRIGFLLIKK